MPCQQGSYLFILPWTRSSPVGTIWRSCRLNLSRIVACLSCIKHHFIEFVCVVCCSIDNLKVKETVGVDVVFSSCTKTRLMQAVKGWVGFGLPPKCFARFCTAGNRQTHFGFKKEYYGHACLCYLVYLLALNNLASGIVSSSLGPLNTLQTLLLGWLPTAACSCCLCQSSTWARVLFTGRHNSKSQ